MCWKGSAGYNDLMEENGGLRGGAIGNRHKTVISGYQWKSCNTHCSTDQVWQPINPITKPCEQPYWYQWNRHVRSNKTFLAESHQAFKETNISQTDSDSIVSVLNLWQGQGHWSVKCWCTHITQYGCWQEKISLDSGAVKTSDIWLFQTSSRKILYTRN